MAIKIGDYDFDGPYTNTSSFSDNSGIYAILCYRDEKYHVIDIGESATVKTRLDTHDRSDCWKKNCSGILYFSVLYTPNKQQTGRKEIEQKLRQQFNPPCGDR